MPNSIPQQEDGSAQRRTCGNCSQACTSDFATMLNSGYSNINVNTGNNLSNWIHPLFHRSKFFVRSKPTAGTMERNKTTSRAWYHGDVQPIDDASYGNLDMTLKLASRMLRDDRVVHYVVTMHDGTLHTSPTGPATTLTAIDQAEEPWHQYHANLPAARLIRKPPSGLAKMGPTSTSGEILAIRDRSKVILSKLADYLSHIEICDSTPGMGVTKFCEYQEPSEHFPRGPKGYIRVHESCFLYPDSSDRRLQEQYQAACTLVHEVAHLLNHAIHGPRKEEVFYHESATNESGFELENNLFGGVNSLGFLLPRFVEKHPVSDHLELLHHKWPSHYIIQKYELPGSGDIPEVALSGPIGDITRVSRVPWQFFESLFFDSFWDNRQAPAAWCSNPIRPQSFLGSWEIRAYIGEDSQNKPRLFWDNLGCVAKRGKLDQEYRPEKDAKGATATAQCSRYSVR